VVEFNAFASNREADMMSWLHYLVRSWGLVLAAALVYFQQDRIEKEQERVEKRLLFYCGPLGDSDMNIIQCAR